MTSMERISRKWIFFKGRPVCWTATITFRTSLGLPEISRMTAPPSPPSRTSKHFAGEKNSLHFFVNFFLFSIFLYIPANEMLTAAPTTDFPNDTNFPGTFFLPFFFPDFLPPFLPLSPKAALSRLFPDKARTAREEDLLCPKASFDTPANSFFWKNWNRRIFLHFLGLFR